MSTAISVDVAVDSRSILDRHSVDCRSRVDRVSIDCRSTVDRVSIDSRSTVDRYIDRLAVDIAVDAPRRNIGHMSVTYQPTVGDMSVNCGWHIGQLSVAYRSTVGRISVNCRSHISRVLI